MESRKEFPIKLYCMTTDALNDPETFRKHYLEMPEGRRAKIDRVRMEQDKKLSLAAGILLDRGLQEFNLSGKTIRIEESAYGKPFFPDFPNIHFSLSHSHEMALAVFADTEVGCDIEYRKKPNEKLAGRFFCPEENAWMTAARTETERKERFYRLWTLKESFIKATGQGLRQPLDSFCFRIEETCVLQSEMRGKTRRGNIPVEVPPRSSSAAGSPLPLRSAQNVSASLRTVLNEHPLDVQHRPLDDQRRAAHERNALRLGGAAVEIRRRNSSVEVTQIFDQAEYVFEEYLIGGDGEYCAAVCLRSQ
ncbi:MAG: 4'-phosphopantetheinyl transferase superfamily protein [Lachnospiraceae bacterium]|nr:4'-phosphopantetheinyl transferase superfamily protein [Lachnospiraceae bacterium]